MTGADSMARVNREIVRQLRLTTLRRLRIRSIRRQIEMIDAMFDELEALQLKRTPRVPSRLSRALREIENICGLASGSLQTGVSVFRLQNALFDLQWIALRSLRGRWADDAEGPARRSRNVA
jgi:hypothetical protein